MVTHSKWESYLQTLGGLDFGPHVHGVGLGS
jgi:hypothetical protein